MVQGYYTIDEAARILKMSPEKLSHMAQKREIRAFADRGTWRFRTQDVEEMARRQGQASDEVPNLANMAGGAETSSKGKATHLAGPTEPLGFELNPDSADVIDVGKPAGTGSSILSAVVPKPGSDSDVHIVSDSDQDLQLPSGGKRSGKKGSAAPPSDSEPQIVPFDDSSPDLGAQGPKSPSDSDVRLEKDPKTSSGELPATEEVHIDLDTDLIKAEEAARSSAMGKAKPKPRAKTPDPKASPFELSDVDVNLSKSPGDSTRPTGDSDVVTLGELSPQGELAGSSASGINLHSPTDSGINLEKDKKKGDEASPSSSSEIEFELSLDSGSTPSPAATSDSDSSVAELDLESSSSEFELTLDDTGGLAPLDDKTSPAESGEKDIFETDLEVPALESDSASEVVPLDDADTDLESSDFDFDPSDSESGSQVVALDEEISDSAATVQRKSKPKPKGGAEAEEEIDEVEALLTSAETSAIEPGVEEEGAPAARRLAGPAVAAAPANWGSLPAIIMIPCVIVMFLLTFMSFELLHDMWGYRSASKASAVLLKPVCSMLGVDLPPD
jgi:excisionase family DNA binding protein